MSKPTWIKTKDTNTAIIWEHRKSPDLTIMAYDLEEVSRLPEDKGQWYVAGAIQGRGIPDSPEIVWGKKGAISMIAKLKEAYKKWGIEGLR